MHSIKDQISKIRHEITEQCLQSQRNSDEISLLAVSKRFPAQAVTSAYEAGQQQFAENYVQEGIDKIQALQHLPLTWHFIGPLQSNKSKLVAQHFDWVHTIDRSKIAKRLNDQRPAEKSPLNILLQVNISADPAKSGICSLQQRQQRDLATREQPLYQLIKQLAQQISTLPQLRLRGLMAITQAGLEQQELSLQFGHLAQLYQQLQQDFAGIDSLSMGMSADFPQAINCGSTMVRIGSAIFGQRTA